MHCDLLSRSRCLPGVCFQEKELVDLTVHETVFDVLCLSEAKEDLLAAEQTKKNRKNKLQEINGLNVPK